MKTQLVRGVLNRVLNLCLIIIIIIINILSNDIYHLHNYMCYTVYIPKNDNQIYIRELVTLIIDMSLKYFIEYISSY